MVNIDSRITYTKLECFYRNGQDANMYLLEGPDELANPSILPKKDSKGHWFGPNTKYLAYPSKKLLVFTAEHNWIETL